METLPNQPPERLEATQVNKQTSTSCGSKSPRTCSPNGRFVDYSLGIELFSHIWTDPPSTSFCCGCLFFAFCTLVLDIFRLFRRSLTLLLAVLIRRRGMFEWFCVSPPICFKLHSWQVLKPIPGRMLSSNLSLFLIAFFKSLRAQVQHVKDLQIVASEQAAIKLL